MLLRCIFIVLAGAGFRIYQKRNQKLKTGTPHENNPVAEKPCPYGAKRNALRSDTVTTAVKAQSKSTQDQQSDAAVDIALVDLSGTGQEQQPGVGLSQPVSVSHEPPAFLCGAQFKIKLPRL
ncbi:hypothetical protein DS648_25480, partial [Salmonella enterica subsp. enterica serovar Saintpaul]|nr:hypothetical protein [Salmonella enterica subsp. enterica serovar Saintpaul]